jgi:hypothetical protein
MSLVPLALPVPARVHAQQAGTLAGVVRSTAPARPLAGAAITLVGDGLERTTRSDERGLFFFPGTKPGTYVLAARRIGYAPYRTDLQVGAGGASITISLERLSTLDTVRVPLGTAIYGVVGRAHDLRALRGAEVQVAGVNAKVSTDSAGRFFAPLRRPGVYVVRARRAGYLAQTLSVTVPQDGAVEVSLLLDSTFSGTSPRDEFAWKEFDDRQRLRGYRSVLVSRADLLRNGNVNLEDALNQSQSLGARGLVINPYNCVFIDGMPTTTRPVSSLEASQVEAVEVYTSSGPRSNSDVSGIIAERAKGLSACGLPAERGGRGPRPSVFSAAENARWVVVWLKK